MITTTIITISVFVFSVFVFIVTFYYERRKILLYHFFKLRDELYQAAIEDKIKKESYLFNNLSMMINVVIAFSTKFRFMEFISALEKNDVDKPSENVAFFRELEKADPEIIRITGEFFKEFTFLLFFNHPILLVQYFVERKLKIFGKLKMDISEKALEIFDSYNESLEKIALNHK